MNTLRIGLIAGIVLGATPAVASAQSTTEVIRETVPFERVQENPCNGEVVSITGELTVSTAFVTDADGALDRTSIRAVCS